MKPKKEWLALWEQNRNKLKCPTDLNTYFTLPEIAGRKLLVLPMGDCSLPTGQVLVRDPLVYLGLREELPYFMSVPTGIWQTELCVVAPKDKSECSRYAAVRICFSDSSAVRFEEPLVGNEDLTDLDENSYFGFGVDAGLGCICDEAVHQAFCDFADHWYKDHPKGNLYDDYFSTLFAENFQKHPAHQRSGGDWLNWVVPGTDYHVPIFQSGFGDGIYPVYYGYDVNGMICQLVIQFIDIQLTYGQPSDNLSIDDFNCNEGLCEGKITLAEWNDLFDTEKPYILSFAMDTHAIMTGFSDTQKAGYDNVLENQEEIAEAILVALLKEYPSMQEIYAYDETEKAELMPNIADTDTLAKLLSPCSVIIHPVTRDGLPYIGFGFGCTWDDEHGFGAMLHANRVVKIGGADTAILTWIAQRDLQQT